MYHNRFDLPDVMLICSKGILKDSVIVSYRVQGGDVMCSSETPTGASHTKY